MDNDLLNTYFDQNGTSLHDHSCAAPLLLILLRHAGCPFCRKTLEELSQTRGDFENHGYHIGLVYMDEEAVILPQFIRYGLASVPRFRDANRYLYSSLGLKRAPIRDLFQFKQWTQGMNVGVEYGAAWPESDPRQLPGAFLIDQGVVTAGHTSLSPSAPPDFSSLLETASVS